MQPEANDNQLVIPTVEVIEDGKLAPGKGVDPAVMQFIMQAANAAQLVRIRKLEESKIPIGTGSWGWSITTRQTKITLDRPWISFSLTNDGPDDLYLRMNMTTGNVTDEAPIEVDEIYRVNLDYAIIKQLFLRTLSGTASIRVFAVIGKSP